MMHEVSDSKLKGGAGSSGASSGGLFKSLKNFGNLATCYCHCCYCGLSNVTYGFCTDIYPKIDESYRVQTSGGAIRKLYNRPGRHIMLTNRTFHAIVSSVSILGWVLIAILAMTEVRNYMTPNFKEHMIVDTSLGQQLRININITFHSLTCNEVRGLSTTQLPTCCSLISLCLWINRFTWMRWTWRATTS